MYLFILYTTCALFNKASKFPFPNYLFCMTFRTWEWSTLQAKYAPSTPNVLVFPLLLTVCWKWWEEGVDGESTPKYIVFLDVRSRLRINKCPLEEHYGKPLASLLFQTRLCKLFVTKRFLFCHTRFSCRYLICGAWRFDFSSSEASWTHRKTSFAWSMSWAWWNWEDLLHWKTLENNRTVDDFYNSLRRVNTVNTSIQQKNLSRQGWSRRTPYSMHK